MHWLQIDVSNLVGTPSGTRELSTLGPIEGLRAGLGWVEEGQPVHIRFQLRGDPDGIQVTGDAWGGLRLSCSRCLLEYPEDFELSLDEKFFFEPSVAEQRDGYEVRDQVMDLEPMLRDAIVLSIPMRPVHAEDCKGLCPVCGADLNVAECSHGEQATDERWAPLQKLLALQSGGDDDEVES